jgi:exonuclease SbcC
MIPIKLEIKNFLSYGTPVSVIDFSNHSLICLSGKNGNGKSALLDAISWALWGQARKVSGAIKADEGLIRLGQTRMMVALEFLSNGLRYRVKREYAKTYGKPYAALYFDLFDANKKNFLTFSENTIRKTQEKIEKIVGLDFDTFTNSAFLRQGQSNEFSTKRPKERKQILANILGLSFYDDMSRKALEHAKSYVDEKKVLLKIDEQVATELEEEKEIDKKYENKKSEIAALEKELKKIAKNLKKEEAEKIVLLKIKYQHAHIKKEISQMSDQAAKRNEEFLKLVILWRTVHAKSLALPDLKKLEKEQRSLVEKESLFRDKQQKDILLQEKLLTAKMELDKFELAYKQVCSEISQKKKLQDRRQDEISETEKKISKIKKDLSLYEKFKTTFEKEKAQFEKRRIFYQNLVHRGNYVQRELKELGRKKVLAQDKKSPSCPMCEQVLTMKRKQFLSRLFAKQEKFFVYRVEKISQILKKLKFLLFEQHKIVQKYELEDERYKQLLANSISCQKMLKNVVADFDKENVALDLLKIRENKEKLKISNSKKFVVLEKERKTLSYDKKAHEKTQKSLYECELKLREFDELKSDLSRQGERRRLISSLSDALKSLKKEKKEKEGELKKLSYDEEKEKFLDEKISKLKKEENNFLKTKDRLIYEKGMLESRKKRFLLLKDEQKKRANEIKKLSGKIKEYQVLASMFGKDGVQALLIEEAIPEVENEANKILSRLTDNNAQIFIESLRDLKKGGVRESLDIHISDASGIRPYEMFSGGEAFRIDFALRIAISKLLARRAGTALQTLIIDEGFGSQDEEGLQRLMDAIRAIQSDFSKIIVVSHLNVLKDNFPVHFIVQKNSLGSFVKVEERG